MSNVYLPQSQTNEIAEQYRQGDSAKLDQTTRPTSVRDEMTDHSFKFVFIAAIIGVTAILLMRHRQNEPEFMIFSA